MLRDSLGDRMKRYESVSKTTLMRRNPVIIRLDGKAFHTFTRGFMKPFDIMLTLTMNEVTKYLCENIQGCEFGYTQSDEITLVICDYQKLDTDAWFDYEVQKMCSISASLATFAFNRTFEKFVEKFKPAMSGAIKAYEKLTGDLDAANDEDVEYVYNTYKKAIEKGAMFDSRCFSVPLNDVTNCILWRQKDATRNSIQSVGQHYFSPKELHGKSCNEIQDMLHEQKGINWNNYPTMWKRGVAVIKVPEVTVGENGEIINRKKWVIDTEMPILTGDGREYVEKRINFEEE